MVNWQSFQPVSKLVGIRRVFSDTSCKESVTQGTWISKVNNGCLITVLDSGEIFKPFQNNREEEDHWSSYSANYARFAWKQSTLNETLKSFKSVVPNHHYNNTVKGIL